MLVVEIKPLLVHLNFYINAFSANLQSSEGREGGIYFSVKKLAVPLHKKHFSIDCLEETDVVSAREPKHASHGLSARTAVIGPKFSRDNSRDFISK
ncbi:uncharacterized protein PHALS_00724 [Plasmopara halstedii]|uniref:Uncharacterized protein n=1 Tax=Plasmopara halstedii TaxID=4781 RepID=A0A0P1ARX4_PLAHL|nr:uncharacterized protein PHALS_00724 [Plasmopara halstedii]CEG44356.1 hypothetical protein PHALS_00724 [Plasmopara halstedii]|eukprot:XP_024580725.1 hypothetical protein PHALS_00724 [Plasmopara halstedii]